MDFNTFIPCTTQLVFHGQGLRLGPNSPHFSLSLPSAEIMVGRHHAWCISAVLGIKARASHTMQVWHQLNYSPRKPFSALCVILKHTNDADTLIQTHTTQYSSELNICMKRANDILYYCRKLIQESQSHLYTQGLQGNSILYHKGLGRICPVFINLT